MSPRTPKQCLVRAAQCERAAETMEYENRLLMLGIADHWRTLVDSKPGALLAARCKWNDSGSDDPVGPVAGFNVTKELMHASPH